MMEPTPPAASFSPLKAAATAGRRAPKNPASAAAPLSAGAAGPQSPAPPTSPPSKAVKFAEPPRTSKGGVPGDLDEEEAGGGVSGSGGGQSPPVKRVGFDVPASEGGSDEEEADAAANSLGTPVFSGISRRKQEQLQREQSERARKLSKYDEREVAQGLEEIPDLEEEGRGELLRAVAHAPRSHALRVQPIAELQREQALLPAGAGAAADIDLSLLTACLCPSEQVQGEGDDVWEPDQLLAALKSELAAGEDGGGAPQDKEELRQI
ncbi:hypothetical protein Rsub_07742 [Raphidocelis subcapitata]|uniref:Uncharacterized protein n=1 Tax=Raphidocelis subcapitata TaxID=307507 RepID=A0A2V0P5M5_9CHLO|nr:hypothetical protein Rsub_07742 [Raphidocelis subcapitata]|eukprot:GBF95158.1 hypothetical protein Rsub_07742 [Raphidocelis subcapitata]